MKIWNIDKDERIDFPNDLIFICNDSIRIQDFQRLKRFKFENEFTIFENDPLTFLRIFTDLKFQKFFWDFPIVWNRRNRNGKLTLIRFKNNVENFFNDNPINRIGSAIYFNNNNKFKKLGFFKRGLKFSQFPTFSSDRIRVFGNNHLSEAITEYFGKISESVSEDSLKNVSDDFVPNISRTLSQENIETTFDQYFQEGDSIILTDEKDFETAQKIVNQVKNRKIRVFFLANIKVFSKGSEIELTSKTDQNNYAKVMKKIIGNLMENIDNRFLFILICSDSKFDQIYSKESTENAFTYPLQIHKLLYTLDYLLNCQTQEKTFYLIQGYSKKSFIEILSKNKQLKFGPLTAQTRIFKEEFDSPNVPKAYLITSLENHSFEKEFFKVFKLPDLGEETLTNFMKFTIFNHDDRVIIDDSENWEKIEKKLLTRL